MILYLRAGKLAAPVVNADMKAVIAVRAAGYANVEVVKVGGVQLVPFPRRRPTPAEVHEKTGVTALPALVLDDGATVVGAAEIVQWAGENFRDDD